MASPSGAAKKHTTDEQDHDYFDKVDGRFHGWDMTVTEEDLRLFDRWTGDNRQFMTTFVKRWRNLTMERERSLLLKGWDTWLGTMKAWRNRLRAEKRASLRVEATRILEACYPGKRTNAQVKSIEEWVTAEKMFGRDVKKDAVAEICQNLLLRRLPTGYPVFLQGQRGTEYFVLVSGAVGAFSMASRNDEQRLLRAFTQDWDSECEKMDLLSGDIGMQLLSKFSPIHGFGEMALFQDGGTRSCAAVATEPSELVVVPKHTYTRCLKDLHQQNFSLASKLAHLGSSTLFKDWRPNQLRQIAYCMEERVIVRNTRIFSRNEEVDSVFFVKSGEVKVVVRVEVPLEFCMPEDALGKARRDGMTDVGDGVLTRDVQIAICGAGSMLGDADILTGRARRSCTVVAATTVSVFEISRSNFEKFIMGAQGYALTAKRLEESVAARRNWRQQRVMKEMMDMIESKQRQERRKLSTGSSQASDASDSASTGEFRKRQAASTFETIKAMGGNETTFGAFERTATANATGSAVAAAFAARNRAHNPHLRGTERSPLYLNSAAEDELPHPGYQVGPESPSKLEQKVTLTPSRASHGGFGAAGGPRPATAGFVERTLSPLRGRNTPSGRPSPWSAGAPLRPTTACSVLSPAAPRSHMPIPTWLPQTPNETRQRRNRTATRRKANNRETAAAVDTGGLASAQQTLQRFRRISSAPSAALPAASQSNARFFSKRMAEQRHAGDAAKHRQRSNRVTEKNKSPLQFLATSTQAQRQAMGSSELIRVTQDALRSIERRQAPEVKFAIPRIS